MSPADPDTAFPAGDKREAIGHWQSHPCGIEGAGDTQPGSREFFNAIDRDRYGSYAPWLRATIGFDRYAGCRLLEVGCGLGTDLAQFAIGGAIVHGIDLVPKHLELTRSRFELIRLPVQLARADAEALPFPDKTFDVVYSFGVLHHTPHTRAAVEEVRRVLRPGGIAIIAVYHLYSMNLLAFLLRELVHQHLFMEPMRRTLARMEGSVDTGFVPLVKVYSRSGLTEMLSSFSSVRVRTRHLAGPWTRLVPRALRQTLERQFGWYLVAECRA
jgi:SAM-dependent methyltransferase